MSKITIPSRYRYTDWGKVINNSGHFFDKATMRFFESRISWDSLTPMNGYYLFITSERSPYGERRYTLRRWNGDNFTDVGGFGGFETLAEAKRLLKKEASK